MTILVTGGTGFIGQKIVHALRGAREHHVRALVRDVKRGRTLESWGCELVEGDITDAESLRRAADGTDCIVHLVAIIKGRPADFEARDGARHSRPAKPPPWRGEHVASCS